MFHIHTGSPDKIWFLCYISKFKVKTLLQDNDSISVNLSIVGNSFRMQPIIEMVITNYVNT